MGSNRRYADRPKPSVAPADGVRVRHVWVAMSRYEVDAYPGLVVEWRRESHGWVARVAYVPGEQGDGTLVERWIEAKHLRPAP